MLPHVMFGHMRNPLRSRMSGFTTDSFLSLLASVKLKHTIMTVALGLASFPFPPSPILMTGPIGIGNGGSELSNTLKI